MKNPTMYNNLTTNWGIQEMKIKKEQTLPKIGPPTCYYRKIELP